MTVTRRGDIDTDGEPIGWKIVGIGKDGSVLCEKPNGQRRRYSFGDGANGKPSGDSWEWLVAACKAYCAPRKVPSMSPLGAEIQKAYAAYESAQSTEPSDRQATIEVLTKERDEAKAEVKRLKQFENLYSHAINCVDRVFQIDSKKPRPLLPNFARLGECKFRAVIRLAEEYAALKNKLANERASGNQVIAERDATIAELRAKNAVHAGWAVEAYYSPPFRIDKPGWYLADDGLEWRVAEICGNTAWGRNACDWYGFCTDPKPSKPKQLTKYLRPLEG